MVLLIRVKKVENDCISRCEHNEYVKRMEDEHNRINHRLVNLEKIVEQMQQMNANISELATNLKHILEEQREQGRRLDEIENEPKNIWDSVKKGVFGAIGAAIGGAIIAVLLYFM